MYEYKTVFYKEGSFNTRGSKNVNLERFDKLLNHYAQQGWRLKDIEKDAQKTFFGGYRDAYIIVFERKL